jgi:hypothetical protein
MGEVEALLMNDFAGHRATDRDPLLGMFWVAYILDDFCVATDR